MVVRSQGPSPWAGIPREYNVHFNVQPNHLCCFNDSDNVVHAATVVRNMDFEPCEVHTECGVQIQKSHFAD